MPSLLAIFAHPDDESLACGGLLACCAAHGIHVSLLCATHGEHGGDRSALPANRLREIRAAELSAAAQELGVADVTILDHEDGMLPWVNPARLESDIRTAVQRTQPDVVITFGEDGLYWHPDHIAMHLRTTAIIATLGDGGPALYYVTLPAGSMRAIVDHAARLPQQLGAGPGAILGVSDPDAFGADATPPTHVLRTGNYALQRWRALLCHQSQLTDCALTRLDAESATRLLGIEYYRRATVGSQRETFLDRLVMELQ